MDFNDSLEAGEFTDSDSSLEEGEIVSSARKKKLGIVNFETVKQRLLRLQETGKTNDTLSRSIPDLENSNHDPEQLEEVNDNKTDCGKVPFVQTESENVSLTLSSPSPLEYVRKDQVEQELTNKHTDLEPSCNIDMQKNEIYFGLEDVPHQVIQDTLANYTEETQNNTLGFDTQPPNASKKPQNTHIKKRFLPRFVTNSIKPSTIPIFICDLVKIETVDMFLHWFAGQYFDYVLLYGKVFCLKIKDGKKKGIYRLDDGTGVVKVHFEHLSSKFIG